MVDDAEETGEFMLRCFLDLIPNALQLNAQLKQWLLKIFTTYIKKKKPILFLLVLQLSVKLIQLLDLRMLINLQNLFPRVTHKNAKQ